MVICFSRAVSSRGPGAGQLCPRPRRWLRARSGPCESPRSAGRRGRKRGLVSEDFYKPALPVPASLPFVFCPQTTDTWPRAKEAERPVGRAGREEGAGHGLLGPPGLAKGPGTAKPERRPPRGRQRRTRGDGVARPAGQQSALARGAGERMQRARLARRLGWPALARPQRLCSREVREGARHLPLKDYSLGKRSTIFSTKIARQ